MAIERRAIERALRHARIAAEVIQTGVGKDAIVATVQRLARAPDAERPSRVVLAGVCGALAHVDPVPPIARVIDENGNSWAGGRDHPLAFGFDPRGVTLAAVDRIVSTPADKHALHRTTGATIVDMESHAFAAACERHALRYAVVRGVSDTPDETLPHEALHWLRPDGSTRTARALLDLLRRPSLIPHMVAVMRRCNDVLPKVGGRVVELLTADSGGGDAPITPLPRGPFAPDVPIDSIALFGGSFDPPTAAHLDLAGDVARHFSIAGPRTLVLYVPAARSPHKADAPHATDAQRLAMLHAMAEPASVWTDEIDRAALASAPSYSIDTARRARAWLDAAGMSATKLRLIIGADQAAAFHRWRHPRELIELAEPLVLLRAGPGEHASTPDALVANLRAAGFWTEPEIAAWRARVLPVKLRDGSSTQVRDLIAARGTGAPELKHLLHPLVLGYIADHNLYHAQST